MKKKFISKNEVKIKNNKKTITITFCFKKVNVNVSKNISQSQTTYRSDNTKQAEMLYFYCGPSKQDKIQLDRLDQKEENST